MQVAAFHERHDEVGAAVVLAELVDADDVRVILAGEDLALDHEPQPLHPVQLRRLNHLDRDQFASRQPPSLEDRPHAAAGQTLQELVARHGGRRVLPLHPEEVQAQNQPGRLLDAGDERIEVRRGQAAARRQTPLPLIEVADVVEGPRLVLGQVVD